METTDLSHHISSRFNEDLESVRADLLRMGGLVEAQLQKSLAALADEDSALAADVVRDDAQVNRLEVEIDEACLRILATRAPAAGDLRLVVAITKAITDLERIGDEVKKVAYKASASPDDKLVRVRFYDVVRAAGLAQRMLRMALDAFARLDVAAAAEIVDSDDELDAAFGGILRQLISYMMEDPRTISASLEIVFIARSIERIGDHAKNIAEAVVQAVRGTDVRHATAAEIRAEVAGP